MPFYRLDEHRKPVPCSIEEGAELLANVDARTVGRDILPDGSELATVFAPEERWAPSPDARRWFETLVRRPAPAEPDGGRYDDLERYRTWEEAEVGHRRWLERLTAEARRTS